MVVCKKTEATEYAPDQTTSLGWSCCSPWWTWWTHTWWGWRRQKATVGLRCTGLRSQGWVWWIHFWQETIFLGAWQKKKVEQNLRGTSLNIVMVKCLALNLLHECVWAGVLQRQVSCGLQNQTLQQSPVDTKAAAGHLWCPNAHCYLGWVSFCLASPLPLGLHPQLFSFICLPAFSSEYCLKTPFPA